MSFPIDVKSTQEFIFRNWPVFIFPQEIKSPLDGVLSASCIFPFQNSIKGFTIGIHVVGGENNSTTLTAPLHPTAEDQFCKAFLAGRVVSKIGRILFRHKK